MKQSKELLLLDLTAIKNINTSIYSGWTFTALKKHSGEKPTLNKPLLGGSGQPLGDAVRELQSAALTRPHSTALHKLCSCVEGMSFYSCIRIIIEPNINVRVTFTMCYQKMECKNEVIPSRGLSR